MTEREETAVAVTGLLPPGVYPVWSPYDAHRAAAILLAALAEERPIFMEEMEEKDDPTHQR